MDYISNPYLQWSTMENIGNMPGFGGPNTPTSPIFWGGFSTPCSTTQTMRSTQATKNTSTRSSIPFLTSPTKGIIVTPYSPLVSNDFSFRMSTMEMPHVLASSTPIFQNLSFNVGSYFTPLQCFPWGGGIFLCQTPL
jgi:hypothetical protein